MSELFWSEPYNERYVDALNRDDRFQKAAKKLDDAVVFRCFDTPEGKDVSVTYRIEKGAVSMERREGPAPSPAIRGEPLEGAFARSSAPYDLWVKLDKGEVSVARAIASPDYRVEGSKLKIMRHMAVFQAMAAVGADTPKRYD
ncbi:MAG: hypothetical protein RLP09_42920 [Sandaracinaceae bacterium]